MSAPVLTRSSNVGVELGYAEITAPVTTTSLSFEDLTGLSITFVAGTRPVMLEAGSGRATNTTNATAYSIQITDSANVEKALAQRSVATGFHENSLYAKRPHLVLTPGTTYTFKVRHKVVAGGTGYLDASATAPAFLRAVEV